jgi:hypothetical protein
MKAVDKFEYRRGFKFGTYFACLIIGQSGFAARNANGGSIN